MFDAGKITICRLVNQAASGSMPRMSLTSVAERYFEARVVGYGRYYAAQGANEQIDALARVWSCPECRIGMYAVLEQSEHDGQYRITNVQHLANDDGLKVTDITLSQLEDYYDVAAET